MSRVVVGLQLADQLGSRWNHRGKTWKFSMVKCWAMLDPQTPGSANINVAKTGFHPDFISSPSVTTMPKWCRNCWWQLKFCTSWGCSYIPLRTGHLNHIVYHPLFRSCRMQMPWTVPKITSKHLLRRNLNPQTSPKEAFRGSKDLLTRYLLEFGCLGIMTLASTPALRERPSKVRFLGILLTWTLRWFITEVWPTSDIRVIIWWLEAT